MKTAWRITGYKSEWHTLEEAERAKQRAVKAVIVGALLGFTWATLAARALGL